MQVGERIPIEAFERFIAQPENVDKTFEYIGGEIYDVPSNPYVSHIAGLILTFINLYLLQHKIGYATGEAGGYMVMGERYAPDVAFISKEKGLVSEGYHPAPPDLAVEVISSDDTTEQRKLRIKQSNYLAAGTTLWVVDPFTKQIEVHVPNQSVTIYTENDTLTGGDLLPDFTLKVADIFQFDVDDA